MRSSALLPFCSLLAAAKGAAVPQVQSLTPKAIEPGVPFDQYEIYLQMRDLSSPLNDQKAHASGTRFWIGGWPTSYCEPYCENKSSTVVKGRQNDALDIADERGQKLYFDADGALRYTEISNPKIPPGARDVSLDFVYEFLFLEGREDVAWWACNNPKARESFPQIYGKFDDTKPPGGGDPKTTCFEVYLKAEEFKGKRPVAWYYK